MKPGTHPDSEQAPPVDSVLCTCDPEDTGPTGHMAGCPAIPPQKGSGDFSIGSRLWPGTSKLLEEMGELQQVLGKLIAVAGATAHWDGDLRERLVEELGDVSAALWLFIELNFTPGQTEAIDSRLATKLALFRKWQVDPGLPTVSGIKTGEGSRR